MAEEIAGIILMILILAGVIYIWYTCYYMQVREIKNKSEESKVFWARVRMYITKYNSKDYEKYKDKTCYKELVNAYDEFIITYTQYGNQILGGQLYLKKTDSAILGGAASAIGGPALGAATYINNEIKNKEIDQHNKKVCSDNAKITVLEADVVRCMNKIESIERNG